MIFRGFPTGHRGFPVDFPHVTDFPRSKKTKFDFDEFECLVVGL